MALFKKKKAPTPVTSREVLETILEDDAHVLVDFYANWCGPCKQMSGMIREIAAETDGHATVVVIDVDASPDLAKRHGVKSVPTLLVFKNGKPRGRFTGITDKRRLLRALDAEHLGKMGRVGS